MQKNKTKIFYCTPHLSELYIQRIIEFSNVMLQLSHCYHVMHR